MCLHTASANFNTDGSVAPALNLCVAWFAKHGEAGIQEIWAIAGNSTESVETGLDFFVVIENPGDIGVGLIEGGRQLELNRYPSLHVNGSATPEHLFALHRQEFDWQVVGNRHCVDVAGDHNAGGVAKVGAGNNCVAITDDLEVRILGQG